VTDSECTRGRGSRRRCDFARDCRRRPPGRSRSGAAGRGDRMLRWARWLGSGIVNVPSIEPLRRRSTQRNIRDADGRECYSPAGVRPARCASARGRGPDRSVARRTAARINYSVDTGFDSSSLTPDILASIAGSSPRKRRCPQFSTGRDAQPDSAGAVACPRRSPSARSDDHGTLPAVRHARQEAMTAAERVDNARRGVATRAQRRDLDRALSRRRQRRLSRRPTR